MSTTMYLRCVTHEPYIESDEVGHNTSYLPEIRKALKEKAEILKTIETLPDGLWDVEFNNHRTRNLWHFIWNHRNCDLEIWDEYGHQYSMEDTVPEAIIATNTVLGRVVSVKEVAPYELLVKIVDLTPAGKRLLDLMDPIESVGQ